MRSYMWVLIGGIVVKFFDGEQSYLRRFDSEEAAQVAIDAFMAGGTV